MLKHKHDSSGIYRSVLLLFSIFILVTLVGSTEGSHYVNRYVSDYDMLSGTDNSVNTYNPSGYAFLGSTSWVFGSVSDLNSNDGANMDFNSYFSGTDIEDHVDNNTSDVDSRTDKGTHSNFSAPLYGPDSICDTLTEQNTDTLIIRPNAAGTKTDWNPVGSASNWECVDEVTPDEDTTFLNTTSRSNKDFYNMQNHHGETGSISNVRLYVRAKGNAGAEIIPTLKIGGVEYRGQTQTLTTSYTNCYDDWATNPAGGNWTWSDIDALEAGFRSSTSAAVEHQVTQLYLSVTYGLNHELDLEVQWTNVDFDEPSEELCIHCGTMGSENITAAVWNGTAWNNVFTDLLSGWNNVSVSSYLDSSTFTIRFKGNIETGDTMQDSWNIDVVLLHTWTDQYTAEVEFAGPSNTHSWKQLNWTIDSAWTIGSVNVTIQLYNYTLGNYPTSGGGHMEYTSSSTPNTDDTKYQLIMSNPQDFRNDTGGWKIKIKGVKNTDTEFDFTVDMIEFKPIHHSGSSQPFGWFTMLFFVLPLVFVLPLLLALKRKRKKTTKPHIGRKSDAFSKSFGMTHRQMIGQKMLLEIDPTSDFHKVLSSFVSEAKKSDELLFILTNKTSTLHSAFSKDSNVKFLLLTSKISSSQQISKSETLLPASDLSVLLDALVRIQKVESKKAINVLFDNISDLIHRFGFEKTYKFARFLLEAISSSRTTALFLFNPTAHEPSISSSIRGLFQIHFAYTKRGPNAKASF